MSLTYVLVNDLDELEYFREEMMRLLRELREPGAQTGPVRKALLDNGLGAPVARALTCDLRAFGYVGRLDTLHDCLQATSAYEGPPICDYQGQCLADALFVAKTFTDPCWPDHSEESIWRLCYRLAALFAVGRAEIVRAEIAAAARSARSLGGQKGAATRAADTSGRDAGICEAGRQLLANGKRDRDLAGIIAGRAVGSGLSEKQIRTILRKGGVIAAAKRKGK